MMRLLRSFLALGGLVAFPAAAWADAADSRPGQIGDSVFTVQGVSILAGLFVAVLTIIGFFRSWFARNLNDAQEREDRLMARIDKHNDSVEDRLKTVEVKIADFMPRAEIEKAILHEKNNRVTTQDAQQRQIERLSDSMGEIRVDLGRLGERHEGIAADVGEIKALVKEQHRDMGARLDKVAEAVQAIGILPARSR